MANISFCSKCGTPLAEDSVFCSKCGTKKIESVQSYEELGFGGVSKFVMIMGSVILIIGVASSNFLSIFFGISQFVIGFVLLKTKSKTIKQLMKYISFIVFAIAIINLVNLLTQI